MLLDLTNFVYPCCLGLIYKPKSVVPGSSIFVSTLLQPEHPPICDVIERSCSVINISSCFVTCKYHRVAVLSVN